MLCLKSEKLGSVFWDAENLSTVVSEQWTKLWGSRSEPFNLIKLTYLRMLKLCGKEQETCLC